MSFYIFNNILTHVNMIMHKIILEFTPAKIITHSAKIEPIIAKETKKADIVLL